MAIAVRTVSTPARNTEQNGEEAVTITSTTAGDLLIACVAYFQGGGLLVTGITGAGTWTEHRRQDLDANSHISLWSAPNVSGGVTSLGIVTDWGAAGSTQAVVIHCSGGATSSPLDVNPTPTTGTGTAVAITSGTLAQADEIVVSVNSHTGADLTTMTEDSGDGFSEAAQNLDNDDGQCFEMQYKVVSATTSLAIDATYNASRAWGAIACSFKGVAAAGRTTKNTRAFPLGLQAGMGWRGTN